MAVSNVTPRVQFTGDGSATEFSFTFVVPASLTGGTITDSTGAINASDQTLTVGTSDFFYTSDLVGKAITVTGAGAASTTLETTIQSRTSGTVVELTDAASTSVTGQTVVVTTGTYATSMKNTADLKVYVDNTLQSYTTHYTVLLNVGDDSNKQGKVIFGSAPADGAKVTIERDITLDRTTDFAAGGALTSKTLNAEFDNIVMAVQDSLSVDDFAVQFPPNEPSATDTKLPAKTTRANKIFQFDSSGDILISEDINLGSTADLTLATLNATTGSITNFTGTTVDINGGAIDGTTIGANSAAAGTFTDLTASTLNVTNFGSTTHTGTTTIATADINGGAIDGAAIGANSHTTGKFTTLQTTGLLTVNDSISATGGITLNSSGTAINANAGDTILKKLTSSSGQDLEITNASGRNINVTGDMVISNTLDFTAATTSDAGGGSRTYTNSGRIRSNGNLMLDAYNNGTNAGNVFMTTNGLIAIDGRAYNPGIDDTTIIKENGGGISLWTGTESSDSTTPSVFANGIILKAGTDASTQAIYLNNGSLSYMTFGDIHWPRRSTGSAGKFATLKYIVTLVLSGSSPWHQPIVLGETITQANTGYTGVCIQAAANASSFVLATETQTWSTSASDTLSGSTTGAYHIYGDASTGRYVSSQSADTNLTLDWHTPTSDEIAEGSTNLYFTNARSDARFDTKLAAADTDDLAEGSTNKYMTNEAIDDRVNALITDGEGITTTYDDAANTLTIAAEEATASNKGVASFSSDNFTVSSGAVTLTSDGIDNTHIDFGTGTGQVNSDNLTEGSSNLYHTTARARASISASGDISYNSSTGVISYTMPTVMTDIVEDTSPQLGGNLDMNGNTLFTLSNADIKIQPHGTGAVLVGSDNADAIISTSGTADLTLTTNGQTIPTTTTKAFIKIEDGENGDIYIQPECDSNSASEGEVHIAGMKWPKNGAAATSKYLMTDSSDATQLKWASTTAGDLVDESTPQLGGDLDVNGQDIVSTSNGAIEIKPNGTGAFNVETEGNFEIKAGVSTGPHGWGYWESNDTMKILQHTAPDTSNSNSFHIGRGQYGQGYAPLHLQGGMSIGGETTADVGQLYNTGLQVNSSHDGWPSIVAKSRSDSNKFGNVWFVRSGTDGGDGVVSDGKTLGGFYASGWDDDASNYNTVSASCYFKADGTHSSSNLGGYLEFEIMPNGENNGSNRTNPLKIYSDRLDMDAVLKMGEVSKPTAVADHGFIYTKNDSGTAEVYVLDAADNETKISPHNDQGEWEYYSKNTKTGKTVRINMERLVRDLEILTGRKYIEDK